MRLAWLADPVLLRRVLLTLRLLQLLLAVLTAGADLWTITKSRRCWVPALLSIPLAAAAVRWGSILLLAVSLTLCVFACIGARRVATAYLLLLLLLLLGVCLILTVLSRLLLAAGASYGAIRWA